MMGSSSQELQTALTDVSKTCHHLWEENKDLQGRFVNELGELQRLQIVIAQLEQQQRLENVFTVKQQMTELQKRAATLYEHLTQKRNDIVIKLNDGTNFATMLQARLLIGDKLGIRQLLVNTNVSVKIIAEDEAKQLSVDYDAHKEIRNNKTVGTISNDFEKLTMNERGHLAAKFNNSKLTRIAHRKPPPKGASDLKCAASMQAATDQKYALLFFITPFQMGNLSKNNIIS